MGSILSSRPVEKMRPPLTVASNREVLAQGEQRDQEDDKLPDHDEQAESLRKIVDSYIQSLMHSQVDAAPDQRPSPDQVEALLANRWWDCQVMEQISQLINTRSPVAIAPCSFEPIFHNLHRLVGSFSNHLIVADAAAGGKFILKTSSNMCHEYSLGRELLIGLRLNQLRRTCPNFVYTMGGFLHPAAVFSGRTVSRWSSRPPVQYIVYENIWPSEPLTEYVTCCSAEQLVVVVLQLVYALEAAYQLCRFTHYDLYTSNVLIRPLESTSLIACRDGYLISEVVAVIIDFDLSYAELPLLGDKMCKLSSMSLRHAGIDPDRPYPMHDIYRLLVTCLNAVTNRDGRVHQELFAMLGFFHHQIESELGAFLNDDCPMALGIMPEWQRVTHQQFLHYLRSNEQLSPIIDKVLVKEADLPVFGACSVKAPCS